MWSAGYRKDQSWANYSFYYTLMTWPQCRQLAYLFYLLMTLAYFWMALLQQTLTECTQDTLYDIYPAE